MAQTACPVSLVHRYVPQPVEPGFYRARIGVLDGKPDHCESDEDGALYCWDHGYGDGWLGYSDPSEGCQASRYVEVQFELPASGNVAVKVIVPPRHQLAAPRPAALDRPALRPLGDL